MGCPRRVVLDPRIRSGAPILEGTHVAVGDIVAELGRGTRLVDLPRIFPLLKPEDITEALAFAARHLGLRPPEAPKLSIVVVVYDMPAQAARTVASLAPGYQRDVSAEDYEILVVENSSNRLFGEDAACAHAPNVRYFLRPETQPTPVFAANFGARQARARTLALCIDGARLLTPGVVRGALDALKVDPDAVVAVPGYHLGSELQQRAVERGYDEHTEAALLTQARWPQDGYGLFEVACLSGSCRGGVLRPFAESNFLALSRSLYEHVGGYDERFVSPGGGYCNLDLYRRLVERRGVRLMVLAGEGTFHQYHGGVTTGGYAGADRDRSMQTALSEYERLTGRSWVLPERRGELFGAIPDAAHRFLLPSPTPASERRRIEAPVDRARQSA
jgi:uncharacterized protein (DUF433 family)